MTLEQTLALINAGYTKQEIAGMEGGAPFTQAPQPVAPSPIPAAVAPSPKTYTAEEVIGMLNLAGASKAQEPTQQEKVQMNPFAAMPPAMTVDPSARNMAPPSGLDALIASLKGIELPPTANLEQQIADQYASLIMGDNYNPEQKGQ